MPALPLGQRLVLALGFAESLVVISGVAGPYAAYDGQPLVQQFLTIFLLPVTAGAIAVLLASLRRGPTVPDGGSADRTLEAIVTWIVTFLIGVHTVVMAVILGVEAVQPWASRAVVVLMGTTLVAVGNLLPRTRPNVAIGLRTARTLADRRLWMRTHRLGGYLTVAVGLVTLWAAFFASGHAIPAFAGSALLAGLAIVFACYQRLARG